MDLARFEALAEAYGADLRLWPAAERKAASDLMASSPAATRAALAEAEALDDFLAASRPPAPSAALRDAVLAGAPRPRRTFRGLGFWLSGAGLAAAGMAGVIAGATLSTAAIVQDQADAVIAEAFVSEEADILPINLSGLAGGRA